MDDGAAVQKRKSAEKLMREKVSVNSGGEIRLISLFPSGNSLCVPHNSTCFCRACVCACACWHSSEKKPCSSTTNFSPHVAEREREREPYKFSRSQRVTFRRIYLAIKD